MARELSIAVPNSKKIYNLIFMTNDTSVDLRNEDIEGIINSTAQIE